MRGDDVRKECQPCHATAIVWCCVDVDCLVGLIVADRESVCDERDYN